MTIVNLINAGDVVDIIVVAMFIYAGLVWFKRTKSSLVVVGIVILGAIYALARYFNLFLTTAILQGFFAVLLIAIIVIFQEELRHFFERVALWGLGRHKESPSTPLVATLVRTAVDLAHEHVGALIVLSGRDPIWRHTEGGTELYGALSEALLKSIFDNSSPGHDGAVIIENGRVARFTVHLPLSKNLHKLTGTGTRHAAALGLSELCDALCIVVSEERGVVSIAQGGDLRIINDLEELNVILSNYMKEKFPRREGSRIKSLVRHNLREKLIAILMAVMLWAVFAYKSGIVQRDFIVPIEYSNLRSDLTIERSMPHELAVTLSGDERAFKLFDAEDLRVNIDVSGLTEGLIRIPVQRKFLSNIPRNLSLDAVRPSEIDLMLHKNDPLRRR